MNLVLLVVQGRPAGKALPFPPGDYYFGRGPECQIRFTSDWVSRQHCLLRVTESSATLRDLGSRNGTLVNGQLLAGDCLLGAGDQIQIGPVVFAVQCEGQGPPPSPSPVLQQADEPQRAREPTQQSTANHPIVPSPPDQE